jgi:glycosyltransferase involved in cell wall biosynthesis
MKVALVHDYLKEYGGAERVLEALHEIWPQAPVYTLVYLPRFLGPHQKRLKDWQVKPLLPGWLPLIEKLISPLRLLAPLLFSRLDLTGYDLVIVSATGAYNPNLLKTRKGTHLCYCHTPPRYLYGLPTAREWKKYWWFRIPAEIANHFLRLIDFRSAQKVDYFIANSKNTAQRIEKFYRKEATVIYPPVDLPIVKSKKQKEEYFLAGGRITRAKKIDLAIRACNQLKLPLKVFGRTFAGYGEELKKMAGPTIEFLGEVTDKEKAELMAGCQAFIFCNLEEDFGIMPVEVQACGRPVISLRQGGLKESLVEGKTGEFFDPPSREASAGRGEPTVESLVRALKNFNPKKYKKEDCLAQAKKFSKERFKREISKLVSSLYARK